MRTMERNLKGFLIGTGLLLAILASRVEALDDVLGWQSTRWGMTEEQVKIAVERDGFQPLRPPRTNNKVAFVAPLKIGGSNFDVSFQYDAGHLNRVTIFCPGIGDPDLYTKVGDWLARKYGPATPRGLEKQEWKFPTTVVELDGTHDSGARVGGDQLLSHRAVWRQAEPVTCLPQTVAVRRAHRIRSGPPGV